MILLFGKKDENSNSDIRHKFVAVCGLCVLYNQIYRNFDKKLFKSIWDAYKKALVFFFLNEFECDDKFNLNLYIQIPIIVLTSSVYWFSNDFLLLKLSNMARALERNPEQSNLSVKQTFHQNRVQSLSRFLKEKPKILFYLKHGNIKKLFFLRLKEYSKKLVHQSMCGSLKCSRFMS
jgi:hypothetical protein